VANQPPVEENVATGEAPSGSPTLISAPKSPPASTHSLFKHREDEEHQEHGEHGEHFDRTATPASETPLADVGDHQSPVMSDTFSEAPTLLTRESNYTANTSGRARQSWHRGIANFWRPSDTFLSDNSSVSESSLVHEDSPASSTDTPPVEGSSVALSEIPVTRPDEPRSFFESDLESEDETIIRTASRASSHRGQRPRLVDHHSSNGYLSRTRFYQSSYLAPPRNPGPSHSKAEQILDTQLKNLLALTSAVEKSDQLAESVNHGTAAAVSSLTENDVRKASTTALAPATQSPNGSFNSSKVIEVPRTPIRAEALDTLPSPLGGFGTLRLSRPDSSRIGRSPLDALRSNPVPRLDTIGLYRATSAPPLPHRRNRKVTTCPVDMKAIHTSSSKKLFRDSVVSTPYLTRHNSFGIGDLPPTSIGARMSINALSATTEKTSSRSPSVSQIYPLEVLVLELTLAKHPLATKTITIPIYDRSTFDDRALFSSLRRTYNHSLLGLTRRFLTARTLSNATFILRPSSSRTSNEHLSFDEADFLKHLQHPKCGHKRKTWLQWLRRHQPRLNTATSPSSSAPRSGGVGSEKYFAADGLPRTPAFVDPRAPPTLPPPQANPSSSNFTTTSSSPAIATAAFSRPPPAIPKVILHTFSLSRTGTAIFLVFFLTVLATTLWVLFGTLRPNLL
jgi:hypothetical protein